MPDSYSETSEQGWLSRIWESIQSVLIGIVLFLLSFIVLFWNEGRAVHTARSLEEGAAVVVSAQATTVDAANEGKLVHITGDAATTETLADKDFGVSVPAIRLERQVQMYQWKEEKKSETHKKLGGGTETVTTYNYEKAWADQPVDSSHFKEQAGHANPAAMPVEASHWMAKKVTVGGYTLADSQIAMMNKTEPVAVDDAMAKAMSDAMKAKAKLESGGYYIGADPAAPAVGDAKVTFAAAKPATISLVARQVGNSFEPYQAKAGNKINMLKYGTLAADTMFQSAEDENKMLTWILRAAGFLAMLIGLFLVFRPIAVLGDVVPFIGSALAGGIGVACFLVSLVLSSVTIALAWITYRPLVGIGLLVVAAAAIYGIAQIKGKPKAMAKGA